MKTFTMNLTDSEHRTLKMYAASKGMSIKDCIMSFFRKNDKNKIEKEVYSFEDFNEETQKAILEAYQKSTKENTILIESLEQYRRLKKTGELDKYNFKTYRNNNLFFDCMNVDD